MRVPRRADRITSVLMGADTRFLKKWLCLPDARQVYDLPAQLPTSRVYDPISAVLDRQLHGRESTAGQRLAAHLRGRAINQVARYDEVD